MRKSPAVAAMVAKEGRETLEKVPRSDWVPSPPTVRAGSRHCPCSLLVFPGSIHQHKGACTEVVLAIALEGFWVDEGTETVPWQSTN